MLYPNLPAEIWPQFVKLEPRDFLDFARREISRTGIFDFDNRNISIAMQYEIYPSLGVQQIALQ